MRAGRPSGTPEGGGGLGVVRWHGEGTIRFDRDRAADVNNPAGNRSNGLRTSCPAGVVPGNHQVARLLCPSRNADNPLNTSTPPGQLQLFTQLLYLIHLDPIPKNY